MSVCIYHVVNAERGLDDCPDCVIAKTRRELEDYKSIVDRIRAAKKLKDWEEVNMAVRELCDL
tara:strand:+ start:156 stop:344 length:189 start_codon:yes stop_codon:yes gene_type:complete